MPPQRVHPLRRHVLVQLQTARAHQPLQQAQPLHHSRHLRRLHLQHPQNLRVPNRRRQTHPGVQSPARARQTPAEPVTPECNRLLTQQTRPHVPVRRARYSHGPSQADLQRHHNRSPLLSSPFVRGTQAQIKVLLLHHLTLRSLSLLQLCLHEHILPVVSFKCNQGRQ